jgi:hypothetical protein
MRKAIEKLRDLFFYLGFWMTACSFLYLCKVIFKKDFSEPRFFFIVGLVFFLIGGIVQAVLKLTKKGLIDPVLK